jgi:putative tryptophan/tyrosine transport system substrate-binding protein
MAIDIGRREFIVVLGGAVFVWPLAVRAQQAEKIAKIGVLYPGDSPPASPRMESFRKGLRQLGYVEGQNVAIELRYAKRGLQQLPDLAAELVGLRVDVITTFGDLATKVAQQATSITPIVAITDDILGSGLIGSLSRPGGNTTGFTILAPELSAKRLELLQRIVPGMSRVACLWDPTTGPSQVSMTENAARALKLKLQVVEVRQRDDVAGAFRAAHDGQAEAINVFASPFLASLYREIIDRAAEYRLPAIYQWKEHTEAGGLMSYGPSLPAMFEQAATIVVKVLKGAKPSDMPVEQPTKFELAINLKTAKALGLAVPSTLLATADDVVD